MATAALKPISDMAASALDYAARGWSVFPAPPGKKQGYKKAEDHGGRRWGNTSDPAEIASDWARWPNANIGVACGPVSGLFVIEADTIEGHGVDGLANLDALALRHGGLPDTIEAVSPSGSRHLFFAWPSDLDIRNSEGRIAPGIDVRGNGGMVITAPSVKPGKALPYRWTKAPGIYELAHCPRWLLELCAPKEATPSTEKRTKQAGDRLIVSDTTEKVLGWLYTRSNTLSRDDWVRLCLALKASIGDRARDGWLSFSNRYAGGVNTGEAERQWETAQPDGQVDLGTAVYLLGGFERQRAAPAARRNQPSEIRTLGDATDEDETGRDFGPCTDTETPDDPYGVQLSDFHAFMPAHNYIFAPSGEMWPGTSVNSRIPPVPLFDRNGEPVLGDDGKQVKLKANVWLDQNRPVEQMTWAPGDPQIVSDRLISDGGWFRRAGCNVFNLYRPPAKLAGNALKAEPWIEHVEKVYPDEADHIIKWLAHRVQRPAEKVNHAIVMGGSQGIGKDTILEPVKAAIGPWNFAEVSPQHLLGRFNGFVKSVILRVSEARDLGAVDRFGFYDHMKTYTAAPPDVLRVDEKHAREYSVFNVCGVIITTNHKTDGIYLPADDRRHFVAWSAAERGDFDERYWTDLYRWYADGGIGHVAAYLAQLPLDSFDAKAPPPKTTAFWDIVSSGVAPEDAELADALDLLTGQEAITIELLANTAYQAGLVEFSGWLKDRKNSRSVRHKLDEAGFVIVRNDGSADGLWRVNKRRCAVYARRELSTRDAIAAAKHLAGWR